MASLWQDLRYNLRSLRISPGFTAVTVLTLALGIGANTAIFSLVNGLILRALPYPQANQLVMIWNDNRRAGLPQDGTSFANLADYRSQSQSFQNIAAFHDYSTVNFSDTEEPVSLPAAYVSSEFFPVMNVYPMLGRAIRPEEDKFDSGRVGILSYGFWQRYLGGDANIVGKSIKLSPRPVTVIGVMPPDFQFPPKAEVWLNLAGFRTPEAYTSRSWTIFKAIGRLRSGVSLPSARAEMSTIASGLEQQYPKELEDYGVTLIPLREQWLGNIGAMLWLLFGAVGFVLLIACVNTASLLLARGAARRWEFGLRLALGAGRARLMRQLLTESLLLASMGGLTGVGLAWVGVKLFVAANPFNIWRLDQVGIDGRVLGFTVLVCLLTGLLFGLGPAWQASKSPVMETLKEGSQNVTISRRATRIRELLVTVEVALALITLVGAGLMIRSLRQIQNVDLGFSTERLLTFKFRVPTQTYDTQEKLVLFNQQLVERLSALPGVRAAGQSTGMFVRTDVLTTTIEIEGRPLSQAGKDIEVPYEVVSAGFLQMMGIPLRQGRMFTEQDRVKSQRVAIVNESMARGFWPGEEPIGKRVRLSDDEEWVSVVGVVADYRRLSLETAASPEVYIPLAQFRLFEGQVVVRTEVEPLSLAPAVRQCVRELDKSLPVQNLQTMEQLLADRLAPRYYTSLLLTLFALIALTLAAVGVFGVLSYQVRQRTHEIGIRVALGARPRDITLLVVRQGILLALIGLAAGLAGSLALARLIAGLLYGVSAFDLTNLLIVSLTLLGATVLASYFPARRAAQVEPMAALRYE